jgi:iron only hydrogenase large subunit-like protein
MSASRSPGRINFGEVFYPDRLDHLSSRKSPQRMLGTLVKTTYYPKISGTDPASITCVSVMPCAAKKFEAKKAGDEGQRLPGCGRRLNDP